MSQTHTPQNEDPKRPMPGQTPQTSQPDRAHTLDDEQRVKVLSPSMLVFRRFIRNRLAIVGVSILAIMTLFSVLGPFISPYRQDQVFLKFDEVYADYAGIMVNTAFRYTVGVDEDLPAGARAQMTAALNKGEDHFNYREVDYGLRRIHDEAYVIGLRERVGVALSFAGKLLVSFEDDFEAPEGFQEALDEARANDQSSFTIDDVTYSVTMQDREAVIYVARPIALASHNIIDFATREGRSTLPLAIAVESSFAEAHEQGLSETTFRYDDNDYLMRLDDDEALIYRSDNTEEAIASLSKYIVQPVMRDVFISPDKKEALLNAIEAEETELVWSEEGKDDVRYEIRREDMRWTVRAPRISDLVSSYETPSSRHWVGTDANGMDLLTRLMYGGRISLSIGFVVVLISLLIGVTMGGISGYFGGAVDMIVMRAVDVFYCIPTWPILIIFGSVMDSYRVDPYVRLFYLMLILGILSWAGIARLVRGQILSLREQEFMVAAEASGLSVYRRIFKHLVPNVVPQLIIIATGTLGSTILTESTLSFLGLGVKYPIASWGNIITAVSDVRVMTYYPHVWIPASICIVITVLGFNFVGDGLRDAFDPKMKR